MNFEIGDRVRHRGTKYKGTCVKSTDELVDQYTLIQFDTDAPMGMMKIDPELLIKLKPKRVAREWWLNLYRNDEYAYAHPSKEIANKHSGETPCVCVRVREVL